MSLSLGTYSHRNGDNKFASYDRNIGGGALPPYKLLGGPYDPLPMPMTGYQETERERGGGMDCLWSNSIFTISHAQPSPS